MTLWFPCCVQTCEWCSTLPATISVTIANITDSTCDSCDTELNTTFVLSYDSDTGAACKYLYTGTGECTAGGDPVTITVTAWASALSSEGDWVVSVYYNPDSSTGTDVQFRSIHPNGISTPMNCGNTFTIPYNVTSGYNAACSFSTQPTCQIN